MNEDICLLPIIKKITRLEKENESMKKTLEYIANQIGLTGNWAVELAKNTLKNLGE